MSSNKIRQQFLDFFQSKGHQIVPSAPIVVKNDPTLMFTNAGMNQFKDIFLGNEPAKYSRVADTQKCLRVSGKHNDLEEVGVDTYHHTMFEMLGNWSFGDYFKKEAIEWAWELLTEVYQLPKDRLYVTVFEGDVDEGLAFDEEAKNEWLKWIAPDRILNGNKKDNFWEMGDTGPCGPCSEIHVDLRSEEERKSLDGATLVNNDHPQVIEIWNLVFMEFNRKADGSLESLPAKHVDTGMGFERLCRAIEGKASNYDTDVFQPVIQEIERRVEMKYGQAEKVDVAMRVLADHIRTISFAIIDGQLPSNNGAGYVIRRILRRAVRYYYSFLNCNKPLLHELIPRLSSGFESIFPEMDEKKEFISRVVFEEENSFLRTLGNGLNMMEEYFSEPKKVVDGETAFFMYDTHGFPLDLTQLIASEKGASVDIQGFNRLLEEQKKRSRSAATQETGDWVTIHPSESCVFVGYDHLQVPVKITRMRAVKQKNKEVFQLVFDQTPFYAESGGQVGDTGYIESINEKIQVLDTQKENNLIVHLVDRFPENPQAEFTAKVNQDKRKDTARNHSATHLLHAALRQVLGTHVEQKGSLVSPDYLRFDFSHFSGMSKEELQKVEDLVNEKIRQNIALNEKRNVPIEEAKQMGAMALFGEKYGEEVRVITFDSGYSVELCGGTHIPATGEIGLFSLVSESAVAAGVRRIEAISGEKALQRHRKIEEELSDIREVLKSKDLKKSLEKLLFDKAELEKKLEQFENQKTLEVKVQLKELVESYNGVNLLIAKADVANADQLKNLSFQLKNEIPRLICVLGANLNQKPMLSVILDEALIKETGLHAGNLVKDLAKDIQGGGGGQPFYATAGGTNLSGLDVSLNRAKELIKW